MKIDIQSVVKFEYTLKLAGKEITHQTRTILMGHAHDLPARLEHLLLGRLAGEDFEQVVPASLAYGPYQADKVIQARQSDFPPGTSLEVGEQFYSEDQAGKAVAYRIIKLEGEVITLDANHPWAGQDLHYRIHILSVRQAQQAEIEHGHVHGEGGVQH